MEKKTTTVSIDLRNDLYDDLQLRAGRGRRRVGAWILKRIEGATKRTSVRTRPQAASPLEKWYGAFHGGRHGSNNRKIDEDIAREIAGEARNGKRK